MFCLAVGQADSRFIFPTASPCRDDSRVHRWAYPVAHIDGAIRRYASP
jgi:hypothetical protein